MPLLLRLQSFQPCVIVQPFRCCYSLQHILNTWHHTLQSAKVNVRTILQLREHLISILLNLILDVHLSSALVRLLTRQSIVQSELIWVLLLHGLPLVVVQQGITVGNSQEQPCLSLVGIGSRCILHKQTPDETSVRSDSSSRSNHDVISFGILFRQQHHLSCRTGHRNLIARFCITEEIGADTFLGRIFSLQLRTPIGGASDTQRTGLSAHVVSVTTGCNGVQTNRVWLSVLLALSRWDDAPRLTLPVRELPFVIDDNVASLTGCLWSYDSLG
mmetsp:Transcript_17388/g.29499  ORF Transcript_17388/g.29499 Transcript_17388/m.29499 type:complete len:273 (+) Transcript_17388:773-1591(+)